jgi:hypothetical protein
MVKFFDDLAKEARDKGRAPPDIAALHARPKVPARLHFIWEAFRELGTDRQLGMAVGPIPWSAIDRYARRYRLGDGAFSYFQRVIRDLDEAWLEARKNAAPKE